jgi:hypothetical protein
VRKFILSAILTAVAGFALLPSQAQASWLSEALHRIGDDRRQVIVVSNPPAYPTYPTYPAAPVVPPAPPLPPAPIAQPAVYPQPAVSVSRYQGPVATAGVQVIGLIDRLAAEVRTLQQDVRIELPGVQGQALEARVAGMRTEVEHLQRAVRSGASNACASTPTRWPRSSTKSWKLPSLWARRHVS